MITADGDTKIFHDKHNLNSSFLLMQSSIGYLKNSNTRTLQPQKYKKINHCTKKYKKNHAHHDTTTINKMSWRKFGHYLFQYQWTKFTNETQPSTDWKSKKAPPFCCINEGKISSKNKHCLSIKFYSIYKYSSPQKEYSFFSEPYRTFSKTRG